MSNWNYPGCKARIRAEKGTPFKRPVGLLDPIIPKFIGGLHMYVIQYIFINISEFEGVYFFKDFQYSTSSGSHYHLLPIGSPFIIDLDASKDWSK